MQSLCSVHPWGEVKSEEGNIQWLFSTLFIDRCSKFLFQDPFPEVTLLAQTHFLKHHIPPRMSSTFFPAAHGLWHPNLWLWCTIGLWTWDMELNSFFDQCRHLSPNSALWLFFPVCFVHGATLWIVQNSVWESSHPTEDTAEYLGWAPVERMGVRFHSNSAKWWSG